MQIRNTARMRKSKGRNGKKKSLDVNIVQSIWT